MLNLIHRYPKNARKEQCTRIYQSLIQVQMPTQNCFHFGSPFLKIWIFIYFNTFSSKYGINNNCSILNVNCRYLYYASNGIKLEFFLHQKNYAIWIIPNFNILSKSQYFEYALAKKTLLYEKRRNLGHFSPINVLCKVSVFGVKITKT